MLRHAFIIITASAGILMSACGHSSISEQITSAELAFANDNESATREICGHILGKKDLSGMEASQMARLSVIYMQLNEKSDSPEDVELAVQCYRDAYKINRDSATAYYRSLPVDQTKYVMTLSTIVHTLDTPREIPEENDYVNDSCEMAITDEILSEGQAKRQN
ncbi:MAG: hypothetical protein NC212_09120 [Staphylococcus sp.]|nr:hypothetical protein [Staphylococcus sp.]